MKLKLTSLLIKWKQLRTIFLPDLFTQNIFAATCICMKSVVLDYIYYNFFPVFSNSCCTRNSKKKFKIFVINRQLDIILSNFNFCKNSTQSENKSQKFCICEHFLLNENSVRLGHLSFLLAASLHLIQPKKKVVRCILNWYRQLRLKRKLLNLTKLFTFS
jgi:hypothetical protein